MTEVEKFDVNLVEDGNADKNISSPYLGYLVGRIKEQLEASIENERQLTALKNVIADTVYDWWSKANKTNHNNLR